MGKTNKYLERAQAHPESLRLAEFESLMQRGGWVLDRQRGSHRVWRSPGGARLPVQARGDGKAKAYQVRMFLKQFEQESSDV